VLGILCIVAALAWKIGAAKMMQKSQEEATEPQVGDEKDGR
jgi:hypothetical protein